MEHSQTMTLWLASPAANVALDLARVVLLILAGLCASGLKLPRLRLRLRRRGGAGLFAFMLMAGALVLGPGTGWAEAPVPPPGAKVDPGLLAELKKRLTAPQDCQPGCAEISRMAIDAAGGTLRLRLAIGAAIDTAIPLPGRREQWQPRQATLDGRPGAVVRDAQGVAWMLVGAGAHQAVLEGPLGESQALALPMKPRLVTVHAPGLRVDGIDAAGVPADALHITALGGRAGAREL